MSRWHVAWLVVLAFPVQAQRVTTPLTRAWEDWRTTSPRPNAEQIVQGREANEAADQRAKDLRDARRRGVESGLNRANTAAGWIAEGLGAVEDADETLDALERIATDRGFPRGAEAARRVRRAFERAGIIDPNDREYEPREAPSGMPEVPSSCEGNPACQACYGDALDKLDSTRFRLEKLRSLYANTYREAKGKISFADGASAVHGVSALAWQKYKVGVMDALKKLDRAYDDKYAELMETLLNDLKGVSQCEADIMKVPDWYDRYGFVYYLFMKDQYKKPVL